MFFNWWWHQLSGLIPASIMQRFMGRGDAVVLEIDRTSARLFVRESGNLTQIAQAEPDEAGFGKLAAVMAAQKAPKHLLLLRMTRANVLTKRLILPIAARRDLKGLLGFELDRETPFARDEVYWDYLIRNTDRAQGKLDIDLVMIPRKSTDPLVEVLKLGGLEPAGIEVDVGEKQLLQVRFGPIKRWDEWRRSQRSAVALAAAACVLVILAVAVPFVRQEWAISAADAEITALTPEAQEGATLRQSIDQQSAAARIMAEERNRSGDALAVLAAATQLLPDDCSLTALTLRTGRLTLTGLSPSAARLVDALAHSPTFREPAFDSPVVQNESGLETFTISVSLASSGGP